MQIDYSNDGHGLPSDFPSDPVFQFDLLFWGLGGLLLLLLLAAIFFAFYKMAEQRVMSDAQDAISRRVEVVRKVLSEAARAPEDEQEVRLRACVDEIKKQFGSTLKLSADFSKAIGALNTAMDGTREEEYKAPGGMPVGGALTGNTIINIAVNQGEIVPYPQASALATPSEKIAMTVEEKSETIWKAVQRIFDYWKHRNSVVASLRAVQQQISHSPPWSPPRIDEKFLPAAFSRRGEH